MILRIVPASPSPTILFTLTFPSLPSPLPFPPAWSAQLSLALSHNLAPPPSAHALDRACVTVELLESVTFDLGRGVVECRVVPFAGEDDRERVEFPISPPLRAELEHVISDVQASAASASAERAPPSSPPPDSPLPSPASPTDPTHPLRSPSLLSLLSSFLPSFSPFPESLPASPTRPCLALNPPTPPSRLYRRLARSRLVDAYARYVQPELAQRYFAKGKGGWGAWVARGAMARASAELDDLLAPCPSSPSRSSSDCTDSSPDLPASLPPTPALSTSPSSPTSPSPSTSSSTTRFPSPLSAQQLATYSRLMGRIQEMKGVLAQLEEREREWCDGARAEVAARKRASLGEKRSRLGMVVWTAEEGEAGVDAEVEDEEMLDTPLEAAPAPAPAQLPPVSISSIPFPTLPTSLPPPPRLTSASTLPALPVSPPLTLSTPPGARPKPVRQSPFPPTLDTPILALASLPLPRTHRRKAVPFLHPTNGLGLASEGQSEEEEEEDDEDEFDRLVSLEMSRGLTPMLPTTLPPPVPLRSGGVGKGRRRDALDLERVGGVGGERVVGGKGGAFDGW